MTAMADANGGLNSLPASVRGSLEELRKGLVEALGDRLESVVVHGSSVRGDFEDGRSDVDVIVVLKDTSLDALEALANPLALARNSGRVETMILKAAEVAGAADVFPLFYDDVKACHFVLWGSDPFAPLEVSDAHRRLRIEQELREARIRMRRAVADGLGSDPVLAGTLQRKVRQLRSPLRALLLLNGVKVGHGLSEILAACGKRWSLATASLEDVRPAPRDAHAIYRQLLDLAIDDVDRLQDGAHA
ncbi:MAG: nucleotidyltransferase domain-containing protein [Thermoanaerobaculia bacterium]